MESPGKKLAPAIRKETKSVGLYTCVGVAVMWVVFAVLHRVMPEKVPFDITVILGGLCGGAVAVLNFFLMALTVQKVASTEDEQQARVLMKASYSRRTLMQMLWVIAAIAAPCFHFAAGILPLLFPGAGIKLTGILGLRKDSQS